MFNCSYNVHSVRSQNLMPGSSCVNYSIMISKLAGGELKYPIFCACRLC